MVLKQTPYTAILQHKLLKNRDILRVYLKALLHGAIFHATCNAILPLGDVKLANLCFHHS